MKGNENVLYQMHKQETLDEIKEELRVMNALNVLSKAVNYDLISDQTFMQEVINIYKRYFDKNDLNLD